MSEELNWIKEAKEHFERNGGKDYSLDKTIAEKSKQINNELQAILKKKLENDNEVELNIQGSKWNIQGQNTLSAGIWYRAYYKKFGKNGLNIAIQIYNNILNKNPELSEKLGKIIEEVIDKEKFEKKDRDNKDERYKDFGFFGMDEWDDDKFQQVLDAYKKAVYKINETLLLKAIEEFNTFLKKPSDIPHLQFKVSGDFYNNKKEIKNNFEKFLENPTVKNLEWWDKSINSANMQGNRTNLIKKIEGLTLEEIKKLDQFFNLFHKIKYDELSKKEVDGYKDLYQYAYLFANLLGKADKKGVEKDSFLEMIKKECNYQLIENRFGTTYKSSKKV